ncbi:MAG: OmpA family protein [Kordiimonadaceae bacterium]|nr:OmpA family protein [Kordiimonadaceae bacterium]
MDFERDDQIPNKVGKIVVLMKRNLGSLSIKNLKLKKLSLTRAIFSLSKLDRVSFEASNIGGARINETLMSNVSFKDVNFAENVHFSNSVLDTVHITFRDDDYDRPGGPRYRTILDQTVILNSIIDLKEVSETEEGLRPPIKSALVNTIIRSYDANMLFGHLCISREQFLMLKKIPEDEYAPKCENFQIFFVFDSSEINVNSRRTLKLASEVIMARDQCDVTVEGYTWSVQTREYSLFLSDRMATEAKKHLVRLGVPSGKLKIISYGKERPKYKRDYLNRRVVVNLDNCSAVRDKSFDVPCE